MPPLTVLTIIAIAVVLLLIACYVEDLVPFGPRRTTALRGSAQRFCVDRCRMPDGRCPLTLGMKAASACPLWRYVEARLPVQLRPDSSQPVG